MALRSARDATTATVAAPHAGSGGAADSISPAAPASAPRRRVEEDWTPSTLSEVVTVFAKHPSFQFPAAVLAALLALRLQQPAGLADAAVVAFLAGFWLLQEWVVHKHLLHSDWNWVGKSTHDSHHRTPYYHISLDPPELVGAVVVLAVIVFSCLLGGPTAPLALTASCTYIAMGIAYEWVHYAVHTRWVPRGNSPTAVWLRGVRRHHMLHHCRNENFWLAFTCPDVDTIFGTLPGSPDAVPLTPLARGTGTRKAGGSVGAA